MPMLKATLSEEGSHAHFVKLAIIRSYAAKIQSAGPGELGQFVNKMSTVVEGKRLRGETKKLSGRVALIC